MKFRLLYLLLVVNCYHAGAQAVGSWNNTGPILFPVNVSGQVDGMGRVCQLKFHPSNPAKLYAVSASGGLYTTSDTGHTWAPTAGTEHLPNSQCSSVCIDYTNDNILYLSTGDPNYYYEDYGIYKSIDGGATFTPANTDIGNRMAVDIIMSPTDHNVLVAATDDGIWRTTNGGTSWTETFTGSSFTSIKQRPGSSNVLYAATATNFYRSTDFGVSWTSITSGVTVPTGNQGMRIAVSAADTTIVYLGTTDGYGEILKSTDGGSTFVLIYSSTTQCVVCYDSTITSGSQGYYNFNLTANPANANELLLVSHCVWRSTDGGNTWSWRTQWYDQVHTDMHDIAFDPYDLNKRFNSNDGGVWLSKDTLATTWQPFSDGLAATEMYHAAQSPLMRQMVSIGSQDNGEMYYDGIWKCNRGGDWGARCGFDYLGNATVYYDNGNRRNLLPLGGDNSYNAPFATTPEFHIAFTPLAMNTAFIATDSVWRSMDINGAAPSWTLLSLPGTNIKGITSCAADSNILYYVTDDKHLYRSDNALAATPTFVTLTMPAETNVMASIATDKYNANIVYVTCNNKVYRSANKGVGWTNITGALPGLNILKIIADDHSTNERIFVSEGNFVYYKDNSTAWTLIPGLPTIMQPTDLMIYNDSTAASILRLSTYGRGVWECNIHNDLPPAGDLVVNKRYICPGDTVHYSKTAYGSITSFVWSFPGGVPSSSTADSPVVIYPASGTYNATLTISGTAGNDTVIKTGYINVSNGSTVSLTEGFEEAIFPPGPQWSLVTNSGTAWQQTAVAGGYGLSAHSMLYDNFDHDAGGSHDRIILPATDLSLADTAYMTFDVAYAYYPGYHDSLEVAISTDCGKIFTPVYEKDSEVLATAPDATATFVPDSTQWRTDTVLLTSYLGSGIEIAFDNVGHYGQNIYIDNINVHVIMHPTSTNNINNSDVVSIYPNPTNGLITVKATKLIGNSVNITCYNELGIAIIRKSEPITNGMLTTTLNLSHLPTGVYQVKVENTEGQRYIKQVVKE